MFREYKIDVSWLSRTHEDELAVPGREEFELGILKFNNFVFFKVIYKIF